MSKILQFRRKPPDEMLAAGDMDGRRVWLSVVEAVRDLSIAGPAPAGTVH